MHGHVRVRTVLVRRPTSVLRFPSIWGRESTNSTFASKKVSLSLFPPPPLLNPLHLLSHLLLHYKSIDLVATTPPSQFASSSNKRCWNQPTQHLVVARTPPLVRLRLLLRPKRRAIPKQQHCGFYSANSHAAAPATER